jgi:hypothetical protein
MPSRFLEVETCQRRLWIGCEALLGSRPLPPGVELFGGEDAYHLLLRVASGLESRILGETEVFGQLKQSWQSTRADHPALAPLFQGLFEDTKLIRSLHLRDLGGQGYGSLVRRLLRRTPSPSGPVLLVGAGQLASSVAPYLGERELLIHNRSREGAEALLRQFAHARIVDDELVAISETEDLVICVPADPVRELARANAWRGRARSGRALHLGGFRADCGAWAGVEGFLALDDLLELQASKGEERDRKLALAAAACRERAALRAAITPSAAPRRSDARTRTPRPAARGNNPRPAAPR